MRLLLFVGFLVCVGCAPSVQTVGTLDYVDELDPIEVSTLLVVPVEPANGEYWPASGERAALARLVGATRTPLDSADLAEAKDLRQRRLPLDSLGAADYDAFALDVLVEALRSQGAAQNVSIGTLPSDSAIVEQAFSARVKRRSGRARVSTFTRYYRAPRVGVPNQFGTDFVLLAENLTVRVQEGRTGIAPSSGTPTRENDLVFVGGRLTLWDDRAGQVVNTVDVYSSDDISRRSLGEVMRGERDEARMARAVRALRTARERFADELEDAMPFLMDDR